MISVLLVDDEDLILELGSEFLQGTGSLKVTAATCAEEALALLSSEGFDVIVSDYEMPEMNGIDLLKAVRKSYPDIPFIIFTGRGREEVVIEALNNGADFYIQKGGDPKSQFQELISKIEHAADRKRMKNALNQSEVFLSNVLNSVQDGISVLDSDMRIRHVNPVMERWYSHSMPLIGRLCYDAFHGSDALCDPCPVRRSLESGKVEMDVIPGPAGTDVEYLELFAYPMKDPQTGDIGGVVEFVRDITARRKVENELRMSEERLKLAMEGMDAGMWDWDVLNDVVVHSLKWKTLLGYDEEDMTNDFAGWSSVWHPDDEPIITKAVNDHIEGLTERYEVSYRAQHKDGEWRWLLTRGILLRNYDGQPVRWVGTNIDITDQKRAEETYRLANRKLNLLSSVTRHDVLNNLLALQGYLELIADEVTDTGLKSKLERMIAAADAIERHVKFTKEYEQIGAEGPTWQNLEDVLGGLSDPQLLIDQSCNSVEIFADPMLRKVFVNLLDNSRRYAPGSSSFRVSCAADDESFYIVWEDDGPGIPQDRKENVFERGFGQNTGLGLFLVREILSLTDITIKEDGTPGSGARFMMSVPKRQWRQRKAD